MKSVILIAVLLIFVIVGAVLALLNLRKGYIQNKIRKTSYSILCYIVLGIGVLATIILILFMLIFAGVFTIRWGRGSYIDKNISEYSAEDIRVYLNELYGKRVDPSEFYHVSVNGGTQTDTDEGETADDKGVNETNTQELEDEQGPKVTTSNTMEIYVDENVPEMEFELHDFSILLLFGEYEFNNDITPADLLNFENMYSEYLKEKKYLEMLNILNVDYAQNIDILERIDSFDQERKSNDSILIAEDFMQNADDRLYLFQRSENAGMLEQSAISAEGAVERENVLVSGNYNNLFSYIRAAVVRFSRVLDYKNSSFDSGTAEDVKYRMGKMLYKPAANLKNLSRSERFYSLCSAYVVLRDAYSNGTLDNKYSVEVAYYYLRVCCAIAMNMEYADAEEIRQEASYVYYAFEERGKSVPNNQTYNMYRDEAKIAIDLMNEKAR